MKASTQPTMVDWAKRERENPPCRVCNGPNEMAELCQLCADKLKAEGYDPFYRAENCGKDYR